jgi:hypothetical protein
VVSDLDIYRAANLLIDRYGADALIEAPRMIDRMLELGNPEGQAVWRRIRRARRCKRSQAGRCINDIGTRSAAQYSGAGSHSGCTE